MAVILKNIISRRVVKIQLKILRFKYIIDNIFVGSLN